MISIIIPVYNERENIINIIRRIRNIFSNSKLLFEIIVVDDNSPDKTAFAVNNEFKNNKQVRLFVRKEERSLGRAILYGIKKSKGDIIIGMDADFNHPPELIPKLVEEIKHNDFVVASRFIKGGGMEDKLRYFVTYSFNLFLKYILDFPTMDNMSGFYVIRRNKLFTLPLKDIYRGYGEYHLRLVWYAKKNTFKIKEIPVYYPKRKYGKSKSNLFFLFFKYLVVAIFLKLNDKN